MTDLLHAAKALLNCVDNITTDEFARGIDHDDREALRLAIAQAELPIGTKVKLPDRDQIYEVERVYLRGADPYLFASYQHEANQRVGLDQPFTAIVRL